LATLEHLGEIAALPAEHFRGVFDDDAIARVALEIAQRLPLLYEKNFGQMSSVARRRNE
jgi:hypothetical protein